MLAKLNKIVCFSILLVHQASRSSASNICSYRTDEPAEDYLMTRFGQYVQLTCCVHDIKQTSVKWLRFNNATDEWNELTDKNTDFLFIEDNQVVVIQSAMFEDGGHYKCKTKKNDNGQFTTARSLHLDVLACNTLVRGPFPIAPLPCDKTEAVTGSKVVLPCTGYYGCDAGTDIRIVQWFQSGKDQENWQEVETDERFTISQFQRADGVMGSNLTIEAVRNEDFNKRFMCVLYSSQTVDGQTQLFTTLRRPSESDVMTGSASPMTIAFILATAIFVSVFTFLTFTILVCCRHRLGSEKVPRKARNHDRKLKGDHVRKQIWTPVQTKIPVNV